MHTRFKKRLIELRQYHTFVTYDLAAYDPSISYRRAWVTALWATFVNLMWFPFLCTAFDHRWRVDSFSVENGSEDIYCARCGCSQTIRY